MNFVTAEFPFSENRILGGVAIIALILFFSSNLIYFMRFSTSKQLHINDHLKAYLGYKSCPRTLGTEDPVYGGTRTHDLVVKSPVP